LNNKYSEGTVGNRWACMSGEWLKWDLSTDQNEQNLIPFENTK
jgi:hypothetical protein